MPTKAIRALAVLLFLTACAAPPPPSTSVPESAGPTTSPTPQPQEQQPDRKYAYAGYLFFYLTCRLGLRAGEVYGITHRQVRQVPPQLIVDQQVQRGAKDRPPKIITRKNDEAYSLELTQDVLDAVDWHVAKGYAGEEFLFSKDGAFPHWVDSYVRPLQTVQRELGLRMLSHHQIGRHSVASQAATGGESIKAIQAQLGHRSEQSTHRYAHLGSKAQLRLVQGLTPAQPPHSRGF